MRPVNAVSLALVGVVILGGQSRSASAATDNLDGYSGSLYGQSGGSTSGGVSWSGGWFDAGVNQSAGLVAGGALSTVNTVVSSAPFAEYGLTGSYTLESIRQFGTISGSANVYVYALVSVGKSGGLNLTNTFGGIGLYKDGTEKFLIGQRFQRSTWGIQTQNLGGAGEDSASSIENFSTVLLLARVNQNSNTITLYINPNFKRTETSHTFAFRLDYDTGDDSINQIRLRGGNSGTENFWQYDNVNILDATPFCTYDTDGDGWCDTYDQCPYNASQANVDTDGDGWCDENDICPTIADPSNQDNDNDGYCDAGDACPYNYSLANVDTDGDGWCDENDICPTVVDPSNQDYDNDGYCDAGDACPYDASDENIDTDGDGWCDENDTCPEIYDPSNEDEDFDGICDMGDECPYNYSLENIDSDGDGWCDENDICPEVIDPSNADTDSDGYCDAEDNCPYDPSASNLDPDSDDWCSEDDNCPDVSNSNQADLNNNGRGDVCEGPCEELGGDADEDDICGDADPCPLDSANDEDGDLVCGEIDNCVALYNPDQVDQDTDTLGDPCDSSPAEADATNSVISMSDRAVVITPNAPTILESGDQVVEVYIEAGVVSQPWTLSVVSVDPGTDTPDLIVVGDDDGDGADLPPYLGYDIQLNGEDRTSTNSGTFGIVTFSFSAADPAVSLAFRNRTLRVFERVDTDENGEDDTYLELPNCDTGLGSSDNRCTDAFGEDLDGNRSFDRVRTSVPISRF